MNILKVNNKEFKVIKLLGKGKGGYSYLVTDDDKKYVLKKIHHEPCSYYQFGDKLQSEINDYNTLNKIGLSMPQMLDVDIENEIILKEYIDGDTVFEMIKNGVEISQYFNQVKSMCDKLYTANINIDYFPTNFVPEQGVLYYIDYECNEYMDEWNFENWGIKYWSRTKEFITYVNKEVVKGFFEKGYSNKDYNYVLENFAESYIDHSPAQAKSNKDAVNILTALFDSFKDLKAEVLDLIAEDDKVASRIKFDGIHCGEFSKISATNNKISFEALEIFKLNDWKITESWGYWPDPETIFKNNN